MNVEKKAPLHCPRQTPPMRPLPHLATVSAPSSPFLSLLLLTHPLLPSPTLAGLVVMEAPFLLCVLGTCSPAPSELGALNSHQQQHLTSWGKLWGKNNVQELAVEGWRRETKRLWGSMEGGVTRF